MKALLLPLLAYVMLLSQSSNAYAPLARNQPNSEFIGNVSSVFTSSYQVVAAEYYDVTNITAVSSEFDSDARVPQAGGPAVPRQFSPDRVSPNVQTSSVPGFAGAELQNSVQPVPASGGSPGSLMPRTGMPGSATGVTGNAAAPAVVQTSATTTQALGGFSRVTPLDPVPISTSTGEKPQSKVWNYAGKHWAVLPNASGTHLWRLDGVTWTDVLSLSPKTSSKADCKEVGDVVHILLYQGASSQMVSVEYVPELGTYQLWSKRKSTVGLKLDRGVETATIDIDGAGRMWLASAGESEVYVRWSDTPYQVWSAPVTVASGIDDDDICAVISMPGKVGVLWSNQTTDRFGFKTHLDGDPPAAWSIDEVPASQSAVNIGGGMADDHMNMAIASDGTLYCAVKTSYDTKGYPEIILLVRRPTGAWDNVYEVSDLGTRPIVLLNEVLNLVRIIYSYSDSGGDIIYKEASTAAISFGPSTKLITGGIYNNSTSTKQNHTTELVVLASSKTMAVSVLATDSIPPTAPIVAAPVLLTPEDMATGVALQPALNWNASAVASSYQVQVSKAADFAATVFDQYGIADTFVQVPGLAQNQVYYWRVKAFNAASSSSWSATRSFATTLASSQVALVGNWKMNEGTGNSLDDASNNGNVATTVGDPSWITGVSGPGLRLNGSSQYATALDKPSLNITGAITLAAWVRPEKVITQYVIKKAVSGVSDGYELSLSSAGQVFFRLNEASSGDTYRLNSTMSYPANGTTWMHIAATYDGSVMKIYINGVENNSKMFAVPPVVRANNSVLALGAESDGRRGLKGGIDEVRIYKNALRASEIRDLANVSLFAGTKVTSMQFQVAEGDSLLAFPNPFASRTTLRFTVPQGSEYAVALFDSRGVLVSTLKVGKAETGAVETVDIDGTGLANGLYFIRLQTANKMKLLKLIMQK